MKTQLTVLLALLTISQTAWASYSIDFESRITGAKPMSGKVMLNEGETGSITAEETTVQFVAKQIKPGVIKIQAKILAKTPSGLKMISNPAMVVLEGQTAEISQQVEGSSKVFQLKMTPRIL